MCVYMSRCVYGIKRRGLLLLTLLAKSAKKSYHFLYIHTLEKLELNVFKKYVECIKKNIAENRIENRGEKNRHINKMWQISWLKQLEPKERFTVASLRQ